MTTDELRDRFLEFFQSKGHKILPSDSLVPRSDPSVLFTGAGMNQFKEQFLGQNIIYRRVATCQRCLRTGDLDKVGLTPGHHTFFEMLGNFSFGDYFKKEAINWAWEFLTNELRLDSDRLWASVYNEDDEAFSIWTDIIGLPQKKVLRFGDADNFWPSEVRKNGPNGPCGPCSEIFYDTGVEVGCKRPDCSPGCDCGRFVEIWNLVFTQFDRKEDGSLQPLEDKNIDTGMGLERLASVLQGVRNNFEIDIFQPIIKEMCANIDYRFGTNTDADVHIKAISDHIRAITFAISDGVYPSNEDRGYIVRKLIRKAIMHARSIKTIGPFLYKLSAVVGYVMKKPYPKLERQRERVSQIILSEEQKFHTILNDVLPQLEEDLLKIKNSGKTIIPGEVVFRYSDEKGVPLDLQEEVAIKLGLGLDKDGFQALLQKQKERSRRGSKLQDEIFLKTEYKILDSKIDPKILDKTAKDIYPAKIVLLKKVNENLWILTNPIGPFYCEAGGQVGDSGKIKKMDGSEIEILNTINADGIPVFIGKVLNGDFKEYDEVTVERDILRNLKTSKNHTATHLLHSALRRILGEHIRQAGSYVAPDRLRFDFTHPSKLDERQIQKIETMVNEFIKADFKVVTEVMEVKKAIESGAIAIFGEKYPTYVSVRTIGDVSKEVCGGTHIERTGQIEIFKIISESSSSAGVRRIEAITSDAVREWLKKQIEMISKNLVQLDKSNEIEKELLDWSEKIKSIDILTYEHIISYQAFKEKICLLREKRIESEKQRQKQKEKEKRQQLATLANELIEKDLITLSGINVICKNLPELHIQDLRLLSDLLVKKVTACVTLLATIKDDKSNLILKVSRDLPKRGIQADKLIKLIAERINGSGGGRAELAQAGSRDIAKTISCLETFGSILQEALNK